MTYITCYEHSAVCMPSESRKANNGGWQTKEFVYPVPETFGEWRQLREELSIRNNDLLTHYLLLYRTAHEAISFDEDSWQKL